MKSILSAAGSALLIAFGLYAGPIITQTTTTGSSFRVASGSFVKDVLVELKEKSGGKVVARANTDEKGKFTFRDVPEGKYTLTMTLPEELERLADTSGPSILKCRLTLTGVSGSPVKKDLDFKSEELDPAAIKKLPGKHKPGEITLTRDTAELEGGGVVDGVITVR